MDHIPIKLKRPIDPLIDCVFKALFGEEENKALLVDFLNSILRPAVPIMDVELLNPAHDVERLDGKQIIVDVKARDQAGAIFHVEVQLAKYPSRNERKLFYWSTLYSRQLKEGQDYGLLRPVTSIWIFKSKIWEDARHHHCFEIWDKQADLRLSNHLAIHTLELAKWQPHANSASLGEDLWLHFLRDAHHWTNLPPALADQPQMRHAMSILQKFSDDEIAFDLYFRRLDTERLERERERLEREHQDRERELLDRERELLARQRESSEREQRLLDHNQELLDHNHDLLARARDHERAVNQAKREASQEAAAKVAAQQLAQEEAAAKVAAQQKAADAVRQTEDALQSQRAVLQLTIERLYEARFGALPDPLREALAVASLATLSDHLPRLATATHVDLLAFIAALRHQDPQP